MPTKRKPPPVFVARTNDFGKTNYGVTADGVVYLLEMRGSYLGGAYKSPEEKPRRVHRQFSTRTKAWRAKLLDSIKPQA